MISKSKILSAIFIIFSFTQYFSPIKCETYKNPITHPLQIKFDYSNIIDISINNQLLKLIKKTTKIITDLISCNNARKIRITEKTLERCDRKLYFRRPPSQGFEEDLIIFPIMVKMNEEIHFKAEICTESEDLKLQTNLVLFKINENLPIEKYLKDNYLKTILKLEILRTITDCLGLTLSNIKEIRQPKNNFFAIPPFMLSKSKSFASVKKLYKLLNKSLPEVKISNNGEFYVHLWEENSIFKDFRNEKMEISYDMSEISLNLFNDMNFYHVSKCDFDYDSYFKCYRIDQKCLYGEESDDYFLRYGFNDDNKIFCYLSNSENLKNNQCGNYYGHLLNEVLDYCPLIKKYNVPQPKISTYKIPELDSYNEQSLTMIVPSKKCHYKSPRTIYFKTSTRPENETEPVNLERITLNESQRKYFVTYQTYEEKYIKGEYLDILDEAGIIRSYVQLGNHNFFIASHTETKLKETKAEPKINKYQKFFHYLNTEIYADKDSLYTLYKEMKNRFPHDYEFMQETYLFPEEKPLIRRKFGNYNLNKNNLWLVKPKDGNTGKDIHIFRSLKAEPESYLITKYISNPHLLYGKKYDLRIYVLVTGVNPLRIYLNKEGLARIAAEKFSLDDKFLSDNFVHLTNTGINRKSKDYVYATESDTENANKWNLKTYRHYLEKENANYTLIREKIADIAIKTVLVGQHLLIDKMKEFELDDRSFFNMYGYDVLIDDDYEPHLLEVNRRPDMYIYDKMDKVVKEKLFVDVLNLVGLVPFAHEKRGEALDGEYNFDSHAEEVVENAYCELTRPRGNFELIFPLKNNIKKYQKFFKKLTKENKMFWEKIKNEKE